jgi:hypothetical protein
MMMMMMTHENDRAMDPYNRDPDNLYLRGRENGNAIAMDPCMLLDPDKKKRCLYQHGGHENGNANAMDPYTLLDLDMQQQKLHDHDRANATTLLGVYGYRPIFVVVVVVVVCHHHYPCVVVE